eukprot:8423306-Pyramimonas_sp.AAC.1
MNPAVFGPSWPHSFTNAPPVLSPKQCGGRPCNDLGIPRDRAARSVTAQSRGPGGPTRPRHPRRATQSPKPCGDPESLPTHHTVRSPYRLEAPDKLDQAGLSPG